MANKQNVGGNTPTPTPELKNDQFCGAIFADFFNNGTEDLVIDEAMILQKAIDNNAVATNCDDKDSQDFNLNMKITQLDGDLLAASTNEVDVNGTAVVVTSSEGTMTVNGQTQQWDTHGSKSICALKTKESFEKDAQFGQITLAPGSGIRLSGRACTDVLDVIVSSEAGAITVAAQGRMVGDTFFNDGVEYTITAVAVNDDGTETYTHDDPAAVLTGPIVEPEASAYPAMISHNLDDLSNTIWVSNGSAIASGDTIFLVSDVVTGPYIITTSNPSVSNPGMQELIVDVVDVSDYSVLNPYARAVVQSTAPTAGHTNVGNVSPASSGTSLFANYFQPVNSSQTVTIYNGETGLSETFSIVSVDNNDHTNFIGDNLELTLSSSITTIIGTTGVTSLVIEII